MATRDAVSIICQALGRGVTRSKRRATQWMRKAAENGNAETCLKLAARMYMELPHAREVGHVGEAAGFAASAGFMERHDVPPDVLTSVVHWLREGGHNPVDISSYGVRLHGARQTLETGMRRLASPICTLSAAVGLGRSCLPRHFSSTIKTLGS